ncbi:MAG: HAD-IA family hydrolase [bacterium]|nr:HAD-IA family hydrolase [bacterium]
MQDALIFDFDGTIADTFTPATNILAKDFSKWGDRFRKTQTIQDLRSMNITEIVQTIPGGWWKFTYLLLKAKKKIKKMMKQGEIEPYPGIIYTLRTLHDQGHQMFIVTSNEKNVVENFLRHYNLDDIFTTIASSSLFNKGKVIAKVCQKYNLSTKNTFYIGDEIRDILASRQANLPIISVTYGYNSEEGLKRYRPQELVKKPTQLLKIFKNEGC